MGKRGKMTPSEIVDRAVTRERIVKIGSRICALRAEIETLNSELDELLRPEPYVQITSVGITALYGADRPMLNGGQTGIRCQAGEELTSSGSV